MKTLSANDHLNINIIANAITPGMSGGDRIFIEYARRWADAGNLVNIITPEVGVEICKKYKLTTVNYIVLSSRRFEKSGLFILYLVRTVKGILKSFKFVTSSLKKVIVYSSSDFWPDSLPAFIMKLRNPETKWIAGFYLFAPKPWQKDSPYKGKRFLTGLFYYFTQLPIYWIVRRWADMVFVTSEPDVEKFVTKKRGRDKIVVIRGGVDIKPSEEYLSSGKVIPFDKRKYDTCFVGRFHSQKGVLELVDIWKLVCKKRPDAKLAMIGNGPLEKEVQEKIKKHKLQDNIELLGFKDGAGKYEIFKQSKVIVHPATYDSGGMAACEAMAWGLPGVSFDLEALKTYYPKGMIKTACYDLDKFAENIIRLLEDEGLYKRVSKDAIAWAREWDWDKRAEEILKIISSV